MDGSRDGAPGLRGGLADIWHRPSVTSPATTRNQKEKEGDCEMNQREREKGAEHSDGSSGATSATAGLHNSHDLDAQNSRTAREEAAGSG